MIIKKRLYPKTQRFSRNTSRVVLTEKIDGSNIAFFKLNGQLYIAQRNRIMTPDEINKNSYKGLKDWTDKNIQSLNLNEGSCICGEWIGQGHLKYPNLDKKFYMFAKANINEEFQLKNRVYWHDFFIYSFEDYVIPEFIDTVPIVAKLSYYPTKEELDKLYSNYCKEQGRDIEGFVINQNNVIRKYVRMKNGKLAEHIEGTEEFPDEE